MRFILLILILTIIYLIREVSILKSQTSNISQNNQTLSTQPAGNPRPRLLFWGSEISPNGKYLMSTYTGDYADRYHYYQVFVTELATDQMHRTYTGDYRTLDSKWTEDSRVNISYNCGNGCKSTRIVDLGESVSLETDNSDKWTTEFFNSF